MRGNKNKYIYPQFSKRERGGLWSWTTTSVKYSTSKYVFILSFPWSPLLSVSWSSANSGLTALRWWVNWSNFGNFGHFPHQEIVIGEIGPWNSSFSDHLWHKGRAKLLCAKLWAWLMRMRGSCDCDHITSHITSQPPVRPNLSKPRRSVQSSLSIQF